MTESLRLSRYDRLTEGALSIFVLGEIYVEDLNLIFPSISFQFQKVIYDFGI